MGIEYFFMVVVVICGVISLIGFLTPQEEKQKTRKTDYTKIYNKLYPKEL